MSPSRLCPQCGATYDAEQRFCALDGAVLRGAAQGGDLTGEVIAGRYLVRHRLGGGGMGEVYLAEHVRMGRPCALKVMRPELAADADAVGRFHREAANASRVSHRNVAAVHDFGETEAGLIYLAMEYVEGEPLRALLERERALSPSRALAIVAQVADALDAAHALGIVHRDLKPDNVMVARERDGGDLVKVVDFGIAKAGGGDAQQVTRTGRNVGTPEYMAPEQLAGDPADARADVYALGLMACVLLTGQPPFEAETRQDTLVHRLTTPPRRLAALRPEVAWPAAAQAALDRALERRPRDRYARAGELARDLVLAFASGTVPATRVFVAPVADRPRLADVAAPAGVAARRGSIAWTAIAGVLSLALVVLQLQAPDDPAEGEAHAAAPASLATRPAGPPGDAARGEVARADAAVADGREARATAAGRAVAPSRRPASAAIVTHAPAADDRDAALDGLVARVQRVIDASLQVRDTLALLDALSEVERARDMLDGGDVRRLRLDVARGTLLGLADRVDAGCAQLRAAGRDPRLSSVLEPTLLAEFHLLHESCR